MEKLFFPQEAKLLDYICWSVYYAQNTVQIHEGHIDTLHELVFFYHFNKPVAS